MKEFNFYEFVGFLVPGGVLVSGSLLIIPGSNKFLEANGITFGEFGLLLIVAYAMGHLVQSIGNAIEWVWWKILGGMPTDWVRNGKHALISEVQINKLKDKLRADCELDLPQDLKQLSAKNWYSVVRQIHATIDREGIGDRVATFNGNYAINRGVAAALLALIVIGFLLGDGLKSQVYTTIVILFGCSLMRMHRFGVHYARELMVKFLASKGGNDV